MILYSLVRSSSMQTIAAVPVRTVVVHDLTNTAPFLGKIHHITVSSDPELVYTSSMPRNVHRYATRIEWSGSTSGGYKAYSRNHQAWAPPAEQPLALTSDPAFRGDPRLWNPELLLVAAASSCQLLSFLALAARAGVDVIAYRDEAEAEMREDEHPVGLTQIRLRPHIVVGPNTDLAEVNALVEAAHHECYIANSLRTPVTVEPAVETVTATT
jgi:organic hydroperoxide reductase OsmC/OhrA